MVKIGLVSVILILSSQWLSLSFSEEHESHCDTRWHYLCITFLRLRIEMFSFLPSEIHSFSGIVSHLVIEWLVQEGSMNKAVSDFAFPEQYKKVYAIILISVITLCLDIGILKNPIS